MQVILVRYTSPKTWNEPSSGAVGREWKRRSFNLPHSTQLRCYLSTDWVPRVTAQVLRCFRVTLRYSKELKWIFIWYRNMALNVDYYYLLTLQHLKHILETAFLSKPLGAVEGRFLLFRLWVYEQTKCCKMLYPFNFPAYGTALEGGPQKC